MRPTLKSNKTSSTDAVPQFLVFQGQVKFDSNNDRISKLEVRQIQGKKVNNVTVIYSFCFLISIQLTEVLERFAIACRKTITEEIALANNNRGRQFNEPIRFQNKCM